MKTWSKKTIMTTLLILFGQGILSAQVAFEGAAFTPITLPANAGVKAYVVHKTSGDFSVRIEGEASGVLKRYSQQADEAEQVPGATYVNGAWTITNPSLDKGYFVDNGTSPTYYWFIDYLRHPLPTDGILADYAPDAPCQQVRITAATPFQGFHCFTPQGTLLSVRRLFTVSYEDLLFDATAKEFVPKATETQVEAKEGALTLLSSLKTTAYKVVGDEYTALLSLSPVAVSSQPLTPQRMEVHPLYRLNGETVEALPKELSAPAEVSMEAVSSASSGAIISWRIVSGTQVTPEAPIVMQYSGAKTLHRFEQAGSYTIVLEVSSPNGACNVSTEPLTLHIQTSQLEVPNAFSPTSSPGTNDLFRVVHKSIIQFQGSIFNEWGQLLYRWDDPNGGWDGTYNGRYVEGGVYYYVIQARGADGQQYNLKGHINILQTDNQGTTPTP